MFDPEQFLNLAKKLVSNDEAETRTAISRAYYAAFLIARKRFRITKKTFEVHQDVINALYRHDLRKTAHKLHRLRRLRNSVDYDVNSSIVPEQAQQAINWAEDIIRQTT